MSNLSKLKSTDDCLNVRVISCLQLFLVSIYNLLCLVPILQNIVNLGTGYETLGISKAGTIQWQLDVELTVSLHNLLFLVRKLISNKLVEAFDWLFCRQK